jgi:hypothetical protein
VQKTTRPDLRRLWLQIRVALHAKQSTTQRAGLDAGDDALDAAPALRAVEKLFEASNLAVFRRCREHRRRFGLGGQDMRPQGRGRRQAEDEVETVGAAEVDRLRRAIMAIGTQ